MNGYSSSYGRYGERIEYYVYVHKHNYEDALSVIHNIK